MQWKSVPGFEGLYEVSDTGLVRSLDRTIRVTNGRSKGDAPSVGTRKIKGRILSPGRKSTGHLHVMLEGRVDKQVHTLVLEAFVGPCPPGWMALHADDDPANNRLDNLSWGTRSENALDAVRNGRHWQVAKAHCPFGHPYLGDNLVIKKSGGRTCRDCANRRNREYRARKRAAQGRSPFP